MLTGLIQNHHPTREHANTHLRNASEFNNDPEDKQEQARCPLLQTPRLQLKKLICQSVSWK